VNSTLSIPVTWDFLLHPLLRKFVKFFNEKLSIPVTWDFLLHPLLVCCVVTVSWYTFNSRYLGFSLASSAVSPLFLCWCSMLSIPVTWDFLLHQWYKFPFGNYSTIFQFPLLGIFSCISLFFWEVKKVGWRLSIPVTWDFLLHRWEAMDCLHQERMLSIPVTWDFLLHRKWGV